jgi:hypothetical protein
LPNDARRLSAGIAEREVIIVDVEEFYERDPRRRTSAEVEFGREWREQEMRFEVAWVADTGELYAMAEPYDRRGITTAAVTIEILAVLEDRAAVDRLLAGWQDAMAGPDSLTWVRKRVAEVSGAGA